MRSKSGDTHEIPIKSNDKFDIQNETTPSLKLDIVQQKLRIPTQLAYKTIPNISRSPQNTKIVGKAKTPTKES